MVLRVRIELTTRGSSGHCSTPELPQRGGASLTQFEPTTFWFKELVEDVLIEIKEYFASIDATSFRQLCQTMA